MRRDRPGNPDPVRVPVDDAFRSIGRRDRTG